LGKTERRDGPGALTEISASGIRTPHV
jgi:hypothetical protein